MTGTNEIEDPAADNKSAVHVGQYKVSDNAIYMPDGRYLPFAAVTDAVCDKTSVHVSGCCAGCVPVDRIVFATENGKFPFIFDSKKDQDKVLGRMGRDFQGNK